ncbi:geranylgeranyl pyrophosphate synthetase [Boeremia exigua]|uniref:geranylgeranyl pyrophosphate synthetase n=1 Tax=Boeremia exigua TaxID=749465 RepID=UPI001E8D97D3|nr:geranylgeranyl pyrophosphate synthetase [Boeremia exigua]KAH6638502.1 geranylgeranyl pyrophosphate synthetase [Boeremia exigua]
MSWVMKNTNALISTMSADTLREDEVEVSSKLGFDTLCTYNWLKDGSAILVPGGPPRWRPNDLPVTLAQDTGHQYIDLNAFRVPKFPFEPAFRALSIMNQSLELNDIDVVVNRNSLRKLLNFSAGRRQDPFRIDLHMINNTLFMSRRERNARSMIHGAANSGYGHNFETAFTEPQAGLDHSSSHHRVIRYKLGSLDCIVRFEVDACYEDSESHHPAPVTADNVEDIVTSLASLGIVTVESERRALGHTKVILRGHTIAPSSLAELKAHKTVKISQAVPQLWFGRTPYLITGKHVEGTVHSISCDQVGERFEAWERTHQSTLRKLVNLLQGLKQTVGSMEHRTAILVCRKKGAPLEIFSEKQRSHVLPLDIARQYWELGVKRKNAKRSTKQSNTST